MSNIKYDYLENETLQNIQTLLEEKDFKISTLLEACKKAKKFVKKLKFMNVVEPNSNSGLDWDIRYTLDQVINQAESE